MNNHEKLFGRKDPKKAIKICNYKIRNHNACPAGMEKSPVWGLLPTEKITNRSKDFQVVTSLTLEGICYEYYFQSKRGTIFLSIATHCYHIFREFRLLLAL